MKLVEVARELAAIAQSGLHYGKDVYDRERYERLREIAGGILEGCGDAGREEIVGWQKGEFGYATPKIDVRGFCLREGKVMLVREVLDEGRWTLPGGWADVNEAPAESVEREVFEESGFEVKARRLLAVWDREKQGNPPPYPFSIWKLFFLCEITGGEARESVETNGVGFFGVDELPELSEARVMAGQIRRCFELAAGGGKTEFD